MQQSEKNKVLVDSLVAMKNSLLSSYEMKTTVSEENLLLRAFRNRHSEYVVFSDYRRNDGRRRIQDAVDIIDNAVNELKDTESKLASMVYLNTLKSVAKLSKLATVLEYSVESNNVEEKEEEGVITLRLV